MPLDRLIATEKILDSTRSDTASVTALLDDGTCLDRLVPLASSSQYTFFHKQGEDSGFAIQTTRIARIVPNSEIQNDRAAETECRPDVEANVPKAQAISIDIDDRDIEALSSAFNAFVSTTSRQQLLFDKTTSSNENNAGAKSMRNRFGSYYYDLAVEQYRSKNYAAAARFLDDAITVRKMDARYYYLRSVALKNTGRSLDARRDAALGRVESKRFAVSMQLRQEFLRTISPTDLDWLRQQVSAMAGSSSAVAAQD